MFVEEKSVGEEQPVKVGTLKLSEAIRIGAGKRPQCRQILYDGRASCAIGAALEGRGLDLNKLIGMRDNEFRTMAEALIPELHNGGHSTWRWYEIGKRNDLGETREQIADWLEAKGY